MTKELTCIICPKGCNIKVEVEDGKVISVEGNTCKRGYDYAFSEVTNPVRTLTSTIRLENGKMLIYAIKIPQPKKYSDSYDCECSRIIFYFNKSKPNFARYITIEYDLFISMLSNKGPFFMLCEWTKHSHNNYGNIIGLDDD